MKRARDGLRKETGIGGLGNGRLVVSVVMWSVALRHSAVNGEKSCSALPVLPRLSLRRLPIQGRSLHFFPLSLFHLLHSWSSISADYKISFPGAFTSLVLDLFSLCIFFVLSIYIAFKPYFFFFFLSLLFLADLSFSLFLEASFHYILFARSQCYSSVSLVSSISFFTPTHLTCKVLCHDR